MYTGWKQVEVTEKGKTMTVYVPVSDDRGENKDLEQFAIGKTKEDLKKRPERPPKKMSSKDTTAYLKDRVAFKERGSKKYY